MTIKGRLQISIFNVKAVFGQKICAVEVRPQNGHFVADFDGTKIFVRKPPEM